MIKKAVINTLIFTLIIINLIIWPSLFLDFKGEDKAANESENSQVADEGKIDLIEVEPNNEETTADVEHVNVETEEQKPKINFKILRIE
ncbi:hypothetical protein [Bacillus sp. S/N-304-OC-R1]|uniref:hypothetical protein n=1 Tax=Bacillus sp. S/N-304-OC-R1 TaxID=2758034 RepID=UPI001C8E5AF1|nr:hypothetical protein [Bacillus sp. S/N-304-OC-R1]MBY0122294.1 hypothetical protein [Bacillus sp. S/N-304-OC-R1]